MARAWMSSCWEERNAELSKSHLAAETCEWSAALGGEVWSCLPTAITSSLKTILSFLGKLIKRYGFCSNENTVCVSYGEMRIILCVYLYFDWRWKRIVLPRRKSDQAQDCTEDNLGLMLCVFCNNYLLHGKFSFQKVHKIVQRERLHWFQSSNSWLRCRTLLSLSYDAFLCPLTCELCVFSL